jgi:hypothetical protein
MGQRIRAVNLNTKAWRGKSMERLTEKTHSGSPNIMFSKFPNPHDLMLGYAELYTRLFQLENVLFTPDGPERIALSEIKELIEAKQDGRCVVLPCNVGDEVFYVYDGKVYGMEVYHIDLWVFTEPAIWTKLGDDAINHSLNDFGKTVFLTRTEALAALKKER